jgi:DNA ligase (NAD+)
MAKITIRIPSTLKELQEFARSLPDKELLALLQKADVAYHDVGNSIMSDPQYDVLREEAERRAKKKALFAEYVQKTGVTPSREEVTLPYFMPSLDKGKPDTGKIAKFAARHKSKQHVVSDKLDGVSLLLVYHKGRKVQVFTRGDATSGQNVTRIAPYLNIPQVLNVDIAVRAEILIAKSKFDQHFDRANGGRYNDARGATVGLVNTIRGDKSPLRHFDVFAYEIKSGHMKPSEQLMLLKKLGFKVVPYVILKTIDDNILSNLYEQRKAASVYAMDGLVVKHDVYEESTPNMPKLAIAFKRNILANMRDVPVTFIEWRVSKHSQLVPRIHIEPTRIGNVTVTHVSGRNAFFITHGYNYDESALPKARPIGKGAILRVVRSGDVIPHIVEVVKPAKKPDMPTVPYKLDANEVRAYLADDGKTDNSKQKEAIRLRQLVHFFSTLGVEGLKAARLKLLMDHGHDTMLNILNITVDELLELPGIQEKTATKLVTSLRDALANATLPMLASATGAFGAGMGEERTKVVFDAYPDILSSKETPQQLYRKIIQLHGFKETTTQQFIKGLPLFREFVKAIGFKVKAPKSTGSKFKGMVVVFTGFRNKLWEQLIKEQGGSYSNSLTKATTLLVIKDGSAGSSKIDKAREQGIPIMTESQFKRKYV